MKSIHRHVSSSQLHNHLNVQMNMWYTLIFQQEVNGVIEDEAEEESLESLLDMLGLSDYAEAFQKEKIDMETLVSELTFNCIMN